MDTIAPLSNMSQEDNPGVIAHHEAGHAVIARLIGREVYKVSLALNVKQSYNGYVEWDREVVSRRNWDCNIPYEELKLRDQKDDYLGAALFFAAGKAAERIWYRQRGLDEGLAGYGNGETNDERELEIELLGNIPGLKEEELPLVKRNMEESAIRRLIFPTCWQAVEAVAQELLKRLEQKREGCIFEEAQACIAEVFAQARTQ